MKRSILLLCIISFLLCANACGKNDSLEIPNGNIDMKIVPPSPSEATEEPTLEMKPNEQLLFQFFEDAGVPNAVREQFATAVRGGKEAQKWIWEYAMQHEELKWSVAEIVYSFNAESAENICLFNIAMLYYRGEDDIGVFQDRKKAFAWVRLSAEKGNADAALYAGDMVRQGDGVPADEKAAFEYYSMAHRIKPDGSTYERLGDCYLAGIGIAADRQKAFDCYLECAFRGYSAGLYKLLSFAGDVSINWTALYKATSSQSYSDGYWAMAYDGLAGYTVDNPKRDLREKLLDIWDNGSDIAASNLKKTVQSDEYFPIGFVEALTQTVYTYSYHAFAEEYGLRPNRNYEDAQNIQFAPYDTSETEDGYWKSLAERYLEYDGCQFYEYDFDGCGEDEIGIPIHSGAGGAFMADGFDIFKKNKNGLYEIYSSGPDCSRRDAMRIIQYDGKIYFIVNWFDDTGKTPHDVIAYTIDTAGHGHTIAVNSSDYLLQWVITYTDEAFAVGYDTLLSGVTQQIGDAVAATKQQRVYSPDNEKQMPYNTGDDWWINYSGGGYWGEVTRNDVFFIADIDNWGIEKTIHRGRLITQSKYYNDYNWFQIYESFDDFNMGIVTVQEPAYHDDFYGLHSGGNIYDLLPVGDNIVQFWTYEHDGATYCVTLQRYGLLYALRIHKIQNGKTHLVTKSLFFDEAQSVVISFS